MEPDLWVDDHNLSEDGTVTTLAEYAKPGVDPQVGQILMVGDGEGETRPARVIERTRDGLVVLRYVERENNSLSA